MKKKRLTSDFGAPLDNDLNSMTAGPRGPVLIQDAHLLEKLQHFNRERIPERVVHAKGAGAHGFFEVTKDVTRYTKADFLQRIGEKTELFARFSTVGGEKGSADAARDPRGFALKFYTKEGNYDMVGNNIPIFFIRDPLKFPDFIHTQKRNPVTNAKDANMFWDFLSLTPESLHQATFLFTDRGTPASYRNMHGFSSHTYKWYNAKGEYFWVKYHFLTNQDIVNLDRKQATMVSGQDPDHATDDLFRHIEEGNYPSWTLKVQILTPRQAKTFPWDIFDVTKVWPHAEAPLQEVGKMVLNRNPVNYFAEVEQAAFNPSNLVPGIAFSPDKMLQGRVFAYHDAHLHRLGPNYHLLPVNQAKNAPVTNVNRDSYMRTDANGADEPNYWPNSFGGAAPDEKWAEPKIPLEGEGGRYEYAFPNDDFAQVGDFWRKVLSARDKNHLVDNICSHLGHALPRIQKRQCALFYKADEEYGLRVAKGLNLDEEEIKMLAAMSQEERVRATTE